MIMCTRILQRDRLFDISVVVVVDDVSIATCVQEFIHAAAKSKCPASIGFRVSYLSIAINCVYGCLLVNAM